MKTVNKKFLNVCTPILNQLIHRLLPETLNTITILAVFLTYFVFGHPSHFHSKQWIRVLPKTLMKLTAAGLFRILTGFPFHHMTKQSCDTKIVAKIEKINMI